MSLVACSQQTQSTGGLPWWGYILIILVLVLLLWYLIRKRPKEEVDLSPASENLVEDDLKLIEGIGPKIESILKAAEIHSFSQLARMDAASISKILTEGGIRLAFPESWPEQARLAAEGETEKLRIYQDELKGGREV
jgi:cbb3-type cytochrome oxidase subunit 3